jgi:hypothetical protein
MEDVHAFPFYKLPHFSLSDVGAKILSKVDATNNATSSNNQEKVEFFYSHGKLKVCLRKFPYTLLCEMGTKK